MAQIVSANVGGAVAGGVVIPQPVDPGYATWPDIIKKETSDILAILNDRVARGGEDPQSGPSSGSTSSTPTNVVTTAGLFSLPVIAIIVILWLLFRS